MGVGVGCGSSSTVITKGKELKTKEISQLVV